MARIYAEGVNAEAVTNVVEYKTSLRRLALGASLPLKNGGVRRDLGGSVLFVSLVTVVIVGIEYGNAEFYHKGVHSNLR